MIVLSYSTIENLHRASHTWINKVLGIEVPETEAMKKGKGAHKKLQDHVAGKIKIPNLDLQLDFPVIEYHARLPYNEKYTLHGYCDAVNFASKTFLEIKTSGSKVWSQGDFDRSMQPAYYSFVTKLKKAFFITCNFDFGNLKTYYREFTDEDWKRAEEWAKKAIEVIESGEFRGGLDETGRCTGCPYAERCHFA